MSAEVFIGLALFALVAGLVPGPNTFMFLAALIRSDDRQAFPQLLGVGWGLFLLASMIGFGLIGVQTLSPAAYGILRAVSVACIVLAAWWIASGRPPGQPNFKEVETGSTRLPLTMSQAATVQFLIPTNWAVAVTAMTLHAPVRSIIGVIGGALLIGAGGMVGAKVWSFVRGGLRAFLRNPSRVHPFWLATGTGLLLATVTPLAIQG